MDKKYTVMLVTYDGIRSFVAWVDKNERWNGYLCPYFEKKDADEIAAHMNELNILYGDDYNGLLYVEPIDSYVTSDGEEVFSGLNINTDVHRNLRVYPVGSGCWPWEQVSYVNRAFEIEITVRKRIEIASRDDVQSHDRASCKAADECAALRELGWKTSGAKISDFEGNAKWIVSA